jgi:IS66 C-terminal element/Transposase C of IS166 homeodomain/Transposase IS66 family
MHNAQFNTVPNAQYDAVPGDVARLRLKLEWFRRQLFGTKSEKRLLQENPAQGILNQEFLCRDTNAIERALPVIPMGRKSWLFCWTELGAHQSGVMQSLLVTCRLHEIEHYDFLIYVFQRISEHPNSKIQDLALRRWKPLFANNSLRSALHQAVANRNNAA